MNRWEYLITDEFYIRQHISSYLLKDCDTIIDIGTYKRKLSTQSELICIDPLKTLEDSYHGTVYQWYTKYSEILDNKKFGLNVLGIDIEGERNEFECLVKLINLSKISVIEFAIEFQPSVDQFNNILKQTTKKIHNTIYLELPDVNCDGFIPFSKRKIVSLI